PGPQWKPARSRSGDRWPRFWDGSAASVRSLPRRLAVILQINKISVNGRLQTWPHCRKGRDGNGHEPDRRFDKSLCGRIGRKSRGKYRSKRAVAGQGRGLRLLWASADKPDYGTYGRQSDGIGKNNMLITR